MTEADLGTGPSKARPPVDLSLNIALAALLILVIGVAGYFGYSVYRDRQNEFNSSATGRLVAVLDQAVRKSPNDAAIRIRLGEALGAMGRNQEAIEQFNAALKIDPKHTGALLDLGMVAMLTNNNNAAEGYFKKVISLTDGNQYSALDKIREQAFYNLGTLALADKQYAEAAGYLKGALVITGDASDTYYQLAKAYQGLGDIDSAIRQVEIALQFDPGFAEAHYYAGQLYKLNHDDVNAAYHFKKAADLAPGADQPQQALEQYGTADSWVAKARTAQSAGQLALAVKYVQVARVLDPNSFDAAKLDAALLIQQGDLAGALPVSVAAGKLNPTDAAMQAQIKSLERQVEAVKPAKKRVAKAKAK
ncbi:MAG: tetratricopeptide repeat protein [Coriobacteriia bacterium]|nr:tetratricopeptide repeat protein [Coriobacteriia bacterium]